MSRDPVHFLNKLTPLAEETAVWPWQEQQMPLRIQAYASQKLPPLDYIGSVRALLFRGDQIMVIRDIWDHYHHGGFMSTQLLFEPLRLCVSYLPRIGITTDSYPCPLLSVFTGERI